MNTVEEKRDGVRVTPVWAAVGIGAAWVHGATVGVALGDSMLHRFLLFTAVFVLPVLALWVQAKSVQVRRLAASMVYFLCALQATAWSLSVAWYRNPKELQTLPDLGHDILGPKWNFSIDIKVGPVEIAGSQVGPISFGRIDADELPDVFLFGAIAGAVVFALSNPLRWLIIRRGFTVYATLMLFRCFTILSTSLPDSHPRCRDATPKGDLESGAASLNSLELREMVIKSLQVMVPIGEITCGDMVFSGHTILIVLSALVWHTYYPQTDSHSVNYVKFLVWTWSFMGLITILGTRLHYSLDVLLAWYLCVTVWSSYHRIANDVIRNRQFCMVWLFDTLIIYPAITYFEEGVTEEGLCTGIHARTVEEQQANPLASPRFPLKNTKNNKKKH